jgi:hypothetical protein
MDFKTTIKVVPIEDASKLEDLRVQSYASCIGFVINPSIMKWTYNDSRHYNLGAYVGNRLVSVMRVEVAYTLAEVEGKLQVKWQFEPLQFPVMVLSKAATCDSVKSSGLNALLRHWAFQIAKEWGVSHVLGTFVEGSPRQASMEEMGYTFYLNSKGWKGHFESDEKIVVAALNVEEKLDQALSVTHRISASLFDKYAFLPDLEDLIMPPRLQLTGAANGSVKSKSRSASARGVNATRLGKKRKANQKKRA